MGQQNCFNSECISVAQSLFCYSLAVPVGLDMLLVLKHSTAKFQRARGYKSDFDKSQGQCTLFGSTSKTTVVYGKADL